MSDDQTIDVDAIFASAAADGAATAPMAQTDIDALFAPTAGFGLDPAPVGLRSLIASSPVAHERLPMLDVIFDRLGRTLSTSLRNFTGDNIDVSVDGVSPVRFTDYMGNIALPALIGVFRATPWDNFGHISLDASLIYAMVDVLLGGRRCSLNSRMNGRAFTTIETGLIAKLIDIILTDLSASFEPLTPVSFAIDKIETNPKFTVIAQPTNVVAVATVRLVMEERSGSFQVMIPYATLEPIRDLLLKRFMGEKFGRDNIWENHLASELYSTRLPIAAVLDEQRMTLGEIMSFEVGQTLPLRLAKGDAIALRSGDVTLARGQIGQKNSNIAVVVSALSQSKGPL